MSLSWQLLQRLLMWRCKPGVFLLAAAAPTSAMWQLPARTEPSGAIRVLTGADVVAVDRVVDQGGSTRVRVTVSLQPGSTGSTSGDCAGSTHAGQQEQKQEQKLELWPRLLVGADGANSEVRAALEAWEEQDRRYGSSSSSSSSGGAPGSGSSAPGAEAGSERAVPSDSPSEQRALRFALRQYPSPAAGLRFKVCACVMASLGL